LAGAPRQTLLGELTALLQTAKLNLRGLLLREGRGRERKEGDGKGREEKGNGKGGTPWFLLTPP